MHKRIRNEGPDIELAKWIVYVQGEYFKISQDSVY